MIFPGGLLSRRLFLGGVAALVACSGEDHAEPGSSPGQGNNGGGAAGVGGGGAGGEAGLSGAGGSDAGASGEAGAGGDAGAAGSEGGVSSPFEVWEAMLASTLASEAHLEAESQRLVAAKDAKGIADFVRTRIRTLPGRPDAMGTRTARRWGRRGLLRSGAGTMREKAELARELLEEAGFKASLRVGLPLSNEAIYTQKLLSIPPAPFKPATTEDEVAGWLQALGSASPPPVAPLIDEGGQEAAALASAVQGALGGALALEDFDHSFDYVPVVRVEEGDAMVDFDVIDPDSSYGSPAIKGNGIDNAGTGDPFDQVDVSLSVLTTESPEVPISLVQRGFEARELPGRQLLVQLVPVVEPEVAWNLKLTQLRELCATLCLVDPRMTSEEIASECTLGSVVTQGGDILELKDQSSLLHDQRPIVLDGDEAAVSEVTSLSLEIHAQGFASVQLRVAALQGDTPVDGLPAAAFRVEEDGVLQGFSVLANRVLPPRVLFLLDRSLSVPEAYRGAPMAALVKDIAGKIAAALPGAAFRALAVGGKPEGSWTEDLAALEAAALAQGSSSSGLWQSLAEARSLRPSVVVMVTDGKATDEATEARKAATLKLGPVLCVAVGEANQEILGQIAALSGGEIFVPADAAEVAAKAVAFAGARKDFGYLLQYSAPPEGKGSRQVTVRLANNPAVASGSYEVPSSPVVPALLAVLLTVRIGKEEVTRALAGDLRPPAAPTKEYLQRVRHEALGVAVVHFEADSPTPHAVMEDLLRSKLALRPLFDAASAKDPVALREAFLRGNPRAPAPALAVLRGVAPEGATGPIFATGLRAAIHRTVPVSEELALSAVDILPFGSFASAAAAGSARLQDALRASARQAVVEQSLFKTSTRGLLSGVPLVLVQKGQKAEDLWPQMGLPEQTRWQGLLEQYEGHRLLVPQGGAPVALWAVDPATGSVLGVLEDGTGGGATQAQETIVYFLNWLDFMNGFAGAGWQVGFWISFQKAVLKQIIRATAAISLLGTGQGPPDGDISDLITDVLCDLMKDGVFNSVGTPGQIADHLDAFFEALTGSGAPCPGL